ncbi:unnamed protein product [Caenorhabditis bovis]|uniref:N-terminal methionine N(alpha)-acetyltransferase NatC n=1 Tax=Caenorhabditis bovis TaxID=2654633 RepID=A0A8S1ECA3_9PELO|nr:unnamed protein product [Caenorhabditis bovis]
MAIGVVHKNKSGALENDVSNLQRTIGTLKRCLEMAGSSQGNRSAKTSLSEEVSALTIEEAVPEASKWPHCQHMISQDEARSDEPVINIRLVPYKDESQIGDIMRLITKDLSEPYSIYTYRYFLHNWPELCYLAYDTEKGVYVGAVLCKLELDQLCGSKGYVAMLAVDESCRRLGLGTRLVRRAIQAMQAKGCDEVVLETEVSNKNAQRLYSSLGFIREKRLIRYYLNGGDAFRLRLIFNARFADSNAYISPPPQNVCPDDDESIEGSDEEIDEEQSC